MAYVGELNVEFRICGYTGDIVVNREQAHRLMLDLQRAF